MRRLRPRQFGLGARQILFSLLTDWGLRTRRSARDAEKVATGVRGFASRAHSRARGRRFVCPGRVLTLGVPIKFWAGIIKWTRPAAPYLHGGSLEETS